MVMTGFSCTVSETARYRRLGLMDKASMPWLLSEPANKGEVVMRGDHAFITTRHDQAQRDLLTQSEKVRDRELSIPASLGTAVSGLV